MNTLTKKTSEPKMKKKKSKDNSGSGKARRVLSKISGAFMLPIAVMAIAGLLLGIGATIVSVHQGYINEIPQANRIARASDITYWQNIITVGVFIRAIGEPIFVALPFLFAAAFVIAFTDEAGVAVFATFVAYITFVSLQSVFITPIQEVIPGTIETPAIPAAFDANGNILSAAVPAVPATRITGYQIIFTQAGRDPSRLIRLVTNNLGIRSLDTSVFGGIIIGLIVQKLYNRFHTIQLPTVISFFGGKRFVALISIFFMIPVALLFLVFWPWIGIGLNIFGSNLASAPFGLESLAFGFIERSLVPFGLHHVFYAPLWYSPIGGDLNDAINRFNTTGPGSQTGFMASDSLRAFFREVSNSPTRFQGDSLISINLTGVETNRVSYSIPIANGQIENRDYALFNFVAAELGIKVGRFLNGKYSFMMMGLPAAGLAMIFAAPKENRKIAIGAVVPAIFTSMLTGVTEPIEFTFLFLAPWLFWGFHAVMCALSFWFANLLGVHTGSAFSGGLLDLVFYGITPVQKGTQFWWSFVVGAAYVPIYFIVFYFAIKKFNLDTPGRGSNIKLFTKSDFLKRKSKKLVAAGVGVIDVSNEHQNNSEAEEEEQIDPKALAVVRAYGGLSNIKAFNNCASRLRYDVVDSNLVDADALKATGAAGVKVEGKTHVQAIYGPIAEQLNAKIKSLRPQIARLEAKQVFLAQEQKQGKDPIELQQKSTTLTAVVPNQEVQNNQKTLEELELERKKYQIDRRNLYDFEATLLADKLRKIEAEIAFFTQLDPIDQLEQEITNNTIDNKNLSQEEKWDLADLEAMRMETILEQQKNEDEQRQNEQKNEEHLDQKSFNQGTFDYEAAEKDRQEYQLVKRYLGDLEAEMFVRQIGAPLEEQEIAVEVPIEEQIPHEPSVQTPPHIFDKEVLEEQIEPVVEQPIEVQPTPIIMPIVEEKIEEPQEEETIPFDYEAAERDRKLYQEMIRKIADYEALMLLTNAAAKKPKPIVEEPVVEQLVEEKVEEQFDHEAAEKDRKLYQEMTRRIADYEASMLLINAATSKKPKPIVEEEIEEPFDFEAAERERKLYQEMKRRIADYEASMLLINAATSKKPKPIVEEEIEEPFDFEAAERERKQFQQDKRFIADLEAEMLVEVSQPQPELVVEEPTEEIIPFDHEAAERDRKLYQEMKRKIADYEASMLLINAAAKKPKPIIEEEPAEPKIEELDEETVFFDHESAEKDRKLYNEMNRRIADYEASMLLINAETSKKPKPIIKEPVVEESLEEVIPFDHEAAERDRKLYQEMTRIIADYEASMLLINAATAKKPEPIIEELFEEPEVVEEEPQLDNEDDLFDQLFSEEELEEEVIPFDHEAAEKDRKLYQEMKRKIADYEASMLLINAATAKKPEPIVEEEEPQLDDEDDLFDQLFSEEKIEEQPEEEIISFDKEAAERDRKQYQEMNHRIADYEASMLLINAATAKKPEPIVEEEIEEQPVEEVTPFDHEAAEIERKLYQEDKRLIADLEAEMLVEASQPEQEIEEPQEVVEEPLVELAPVDGLLALKEALKAAALVQEKQPEEEIVEEEPQPKEDEDDLFDELFSEEKSEDEVEELAEEPIEEEVEEEPQETEEILEEEPIVPPTPIDTPEDPIQPPMLQHKVRPFYEGEFSVYRPIVNSISDGQEPQLQQTLAKEPTKNKEVKPKQQKPEKQPKPIEEPKPEVVEPPVEKVEEPKIEEPTIEEPQVVPPVVVLPEEEDEEEVEVTTEDDGTQKTRLKDQIVFAPAIGKIRTLKSLRDGEFSEGVYGEGFAVRFSADKMGRVYAPFDAKVIFVSSAKNKFVIKSRKGVEVTLQVGIGSEILGGEGFKVSVNEGQQVKTGDLIVTIDLELIKKSRLRNDLIFAVSPTSRRTQLTITKEEKEITRVAAEVAKVSKVSE